ncbi:MAG: MobF family relaxase [Opitutales bacterium]
MITASKIKGGDGYMKRHLSANDYYCEEETVVGYWRGKGAEMLGIEGQEVTADAFESLRTNKHPLSDEKLRPRNSDVAYHDIVISCPKTISIAALVGGDERLINAFERVVDEVFNELEAYASRRDRKGGNYRTENTVKTGNAVAAVYHHDTSRLLDPQLHAHCVFSNHTWCPEDQRWYALQPREMMEKSKEFIRDRFYKRMAQECERLGYDVHWKKDAQTGLSVPRLTKISTEMELQFSRRARQKVEFISRYETLFGKKPDERRIEHFIKETKGAATKRFIGEYENAFGHTPGDDVVKSFVRDWRSSKMAHSSQEQVFAGQQALLTREQRQSLRKTVQQAILTEQGMTAESLNTAGEPEKEKLQENIHIEGLENHVIGSQGHSTRDTRVKPREAIKERAQRPERSRFEAMRKLRRGQAVLKALNGNPTALIAYELRRSAGRRR